jgi:hypothetical protein
MAAHSTHRCCTSCDVPLVYNAWPCSPQYLDSCVWVHSCIHAPCWEMRPLPSPSSFQVFPVLAFTLSGTPPSNGRLVPPGVQSTGLLPSQGGSGRGWRSPGSPRCHWPTWQVRQCNMLGKPPGVKHLGYQRWPAVDSSKITECITWYPQPS